MIKRVVVGTLCVLAALVDAESTCRFALNVSPAGLKLLGNSGSSGTASQTNSSGNATSTLTPAPTTKSTFNGRLLLAENATLAPTSSPTATTIPPSEKTTEPVSTPSTTTKDGKTPAPTTAPATGSSTGAPTTSPAPGSTTVPVATSNSTNSTISVPTQAVQTTYDVIPCDSNFYKFWKTKGLTCGGADLDVTKAMAQSCIVYSGSIKIASVGIPACFSSCFIPGCTNNAWDYSSQDGISSSIYSGVNFLEAATLSKASSSATASLFSSLSTAFTSSFSCSTYDICQCPAANAVSSNSNSSQSGSQKSTDTWSDGTKKTTLDYVGTVTSSVSTTVTYTAIATTTTMVIASTIGAVGSSATAAAAGISAGGSVGMAGATIDIAQFSVCISQLSLPGASQPLRAIGEQMSFSVFNWFTFGNVPTTTTNTTSSSKRRLVDEYTGSRNVESSGMFQYTSRLGIRPEMLFYVTLAGIASIIGGIIIILALVLVLGPMCVKDKQAFMQNCYDRAIGFIMLITILCQYALGVVCMFEICICVKSKGSTFTKEFFFAILTLLILAIGVIGYGVYVVKKYQRDIEDIGTAQHLEKTVHKRFGCLYDEYDFHNRYFFTAKMGLALLSGMVAGAIAITGQTQLVILIILHVAFFLLLSVRRPHYAPFVQNTTVVITVVKVIVFGLSFTLLAVSGAVTSKLQGAISSVILALQLAVLLCLLIRQIYIFYKTHQLKKELDTYNETLRNEDAYAMEAVTQPGAYAMANTSQRDTHQYAKREWTSESTRFSEDKAQTLNNRYQQNPSKKLNSIKSTEHNGKWKEDEYDPREYAI